MKSRSVLFVFAALVVVMIASPAVAAKKPKVKEMLLPASGFPEISAADQAVTDVPFAEGSPAVILLNAQQSEWEGYAWVRTHFYRRTKILTQDGVAEYGDLSWNLLGDWRVKKIEARTVLPDGTVIDAAEGVFRETSEDDMVKLVRVSFPRVEVGAILDFHLSLTSDNINIAPWIIQEDLPVMHSRFIMLPPVGLRFRKTLVGLPPELGEPASVNMSGERKAHVWVFEDIKPLLHEPFSPPSSDVAQRLIISLDSYRDQANYVPLAADWKSYNKNRKDFWDEWMKQKHSETEALARQVTSGKGSALEKAEAVRQVLEERVAVESYAAWPYHESPDAVLSEGHGASADVAATAVAMLRAVGVEAELAAIRRRSSGSIPAEFPIPALFDHLLVRLPGGDSGTYFSVDCKLPIGTLPGNCRGTLALLLDGESEKPDPIPDLKAADNRTDRVTEATLQPDGQIAATSTLTFRGREAERWRTRLDKKDDESRRSRLQSSLKTHVPGAEIESVEIENLDDPRQDLVVRYTWSATGYAVPAGKRLLINPFLFNRFSTEDWTAETRKEPIDFGNAYDDYDTLRLTLPEGAQDVTLPSKSKMDAGPAGLYETTLTRTGGTVVVKRHMRLAIHIYPPKSYMSLRRWFSDIAKADDEPIVVTMR